jgi:peroxiredoxin
MKSVYFCLLLVSITLLSFTLGDKKFPKADLKTLNGETVHLNASFDKHKLTVVSFWATWCSPCKKELDAIKELYPEWKKLGVELVAVTIDDAQALNKVKPMVAQKGWTYTILSDQNKDMLRLLNFSSVPQTFVVDATGNIVYTHNGYAPGDEYELEKKLKELLK